MSAETRMRSGVLSWQECARLCKSPSPLPHVAIGFVWGQTDHVLRRFLETTALPHLRRLHIESPAWDGGPGRLFRGLAALGRPLDEMSVVTSLDLARRRLVTFTVRVDPNGEPITVWSLPSEPPLEGELDAAICGLGLPRPPVPAGTTGA